MKILLLWLAMGAVCMAQEGNYYDPSDPVGSAERGATAIRPQAPLFTGRPINEDGDGSAVTTFSPNGAYTTFEGGGSCVTTCTQGGCYTTCVR